MKRIILSFSLLFLSFLNVHAQVGIGISTPSPSSQLDIVATNKGILIPRIALTSTTDATTISGGNVNSLLVFNTQTLGDVVPGYYYWYINKWIRLGAVGNITNLIDNGDGTITYVNELNIRETVNIAQIVKAYETLTSATFNSTTGVLTYIDEHNVSTTLNLSTMIPNFETLTSISQNVAAGTITYIDEKGVSTVLDIAALIKQHETLTSATFDNTTGVLTYIDEHNVSTTLNLSTMIPNFETLTSISQDVAAGTITYVDEKGVSTVLNLAAVIKQHETLTSATFDNTTGVLTYIDEHNVSTTLNLSTMIPNFETLTSISQDVAAGTITYVDEKGVSTVLDIAALIKQHETLTSATFDNTTGVLTYIDEHNVSTTLNLSTMIPNFETLTSISQDVAAGTITYVDEKGVSTVLDILAVIKQHETLTSATFDAITGILTYNDEDGTANALNLSTMIPNFETLTSISQDVAAGTITYVDENGGSTVLDILAVIKQHETLTSATFDAITGILTYNDEDGTANALNLSTMIPNFETLTSISQDVAAGTITYVDENGGSTVLDILTLIKQHETLTSATFDATTGILTYNDEDGTANALNLSTMIPNFETLTSISQDVPAGTITYIDENGGSTVLDIAALIKQHETITTLGLSNGTLSYANENATNLPVNLVSTDTNNAIAAGTDGALFADKTTLMIEPWFSQTTLDKATLNTENIYQMGRVAINKQTADKQLDVNGDFRSSILGPDGKIHSVEVNSVDLGRPSTHLSVANQDPTLDLAIVAVEDGTATIYSKGITSQSASISTTSNLGVRFIFSTTSGTFEGAYNFPRNSGLPNQILMTNGNGTNTQLQWVNPQTLFNVNAHNGLQGGGSDVALGGTLEIPTTITTDNTNTLAIQGLQPSTATTDKVVVTDVNGVLKNSSGAMPKFFYMPAITFDTSVITTGLTKNLYQEYVNQFSNVAVRSAGAPVDIPYMPANTDLYYYVTYFDPTVFANLSIDANGMLTYDIIGSGTPTSYLNIVFVLK